MSDLSVSAPDEAPAKPVQSYRVSWPQQILGVIGFALSLYSYREYLVVMNGGSACGADNSYISCDKVLNSDFSAFHHIPLGIFGMVFFAIVVITSIDTDLKPAAIVKSAGWRLLVAIGGLFSSLGMLYISFMLIHAMCPICIATHTASISNFGYSLFDFMRLRGRREAPEIPNPTTKL